MSLETEDTFQNKPPSLCVNLKKVILLFKVATIFEQFPIFDIPSLTSLDAFAKISCQAIEMHRFSLIKNFFTALKFLFL